MTHYVYVIGRRQGPVKVGITNGPGGRLSTLQTGCPFKLELLRLFPMRDRDHALWHENNFHVIWAANRLMGEWFKADAEIAIESIESGLEAEDYYEGIAA